MPPSPSINQNNIHGRAKISHLGTARMKQTFPPLSEILFLPRIFQSRLNKSDIKWTSARARNFNWLVYKGLQPKSFIDFVHQLQDGRQIRISKTTDEPERFLRQQTKNSIDI